MGHAELMSNGVSSCFCFVFFWHRPRYIAIIALTIVATVVLESLVHGGGANTSRHTIQAQASRQQADIQTHESTNKQTASRHTRHKKTTTSTRIHRDIQNTRRQVRHTKTTTDTIIHRDNNRQHMH